MRADRFTRSNRGKKLKWISRFCWLAPALLPLFTIDTLAEPVPNLYRAETIITGTEEPERSRGLREAFRELLVKVTGNAGHRDNPALLPLLERAGEFVQEIELEDRMRGIPVHDEQGTRERPHYLRVLFKEDAVNRALAELGIKVWPADRPTVAVWFVVRTPGEHYVLQPQGAQGYGQREVFLETSQRIGLPIVLAPNPPGAEILSPQDVIAPSAALLKEATSRGEALLLGSIDLTHEGYWDAQWLLAWRGEETRWSLDDVTFDTAIRSGLQKTAGILSAAQ